MIYWTGGGPNLLSPQAFVEVHGTNPPSRPSVGTPIRIRDAATLAEITTGLYDADGNAATQITTLDDGYLIFGVDDLRVVDISADAFSTITRLVMTNAVIEAITSAQAAESDAASALFGPAELQPVRAALAGRYEGRARIVVIGDENAEGQGATPVSRRWVSRLQAALRNAFSLSGGGAGYLPARYTSAGMPTPAVVDLSATGSAAAPDNRYGLGGRALSLTKAGALVYSQNFTSFVVGYALDPNGTNLKVIVDGLPVATLNTNGTAAGGIAWVSPTYAPGLHTVRLENGDPTVGYVTIVEGVDFRNGDEQSGITVYDASHTGWRADDFTAQHDKALTPISPDLVIHAIGAVDALTQTSAAFRASLVSRIARANTAISNVHSTIILAMPARTDALVEPWANYVTAMQSVADVTANTTLVDLGRRMPAVAADTLSLFSDSYHLTNRGHALVEDAVFAAIVPAAAGGGGAAGGAGAVADVNGQIGHVVLDAASVGAAAAVHAHSAAQITSGTLAVAQAPPGSMIAVIKSGSTWPARPTVRADIVINWIGADPSPPLVTSGTSGMYASDYRSVR